jgi:hypothetical protein
MRQEVLLVSVWFLAQAAVAAAQVPEWQAIGGLPVEPVVAIAVHPSQSQRVFASTRHALYESSDDGRQWTERFRVSAMTTIAGIAVEAAESGTILVATDHGLYGSFDDGQTFSQVFNGAAEGKSHCTYVMFHPNTRGGAWLGTGAGLFVSVDRGMTWKPVDLPQAARQVIHFAFDPQESERMYLVASGGFFLGHIAQGRWEQRLTKVVAEVAEVEEPSQPFETGEEDDLFHHLSAVAIDPQRPSTVYLASSDGVLTSDDRGMSWRRLGSSGLSSTSLSRLLLQRHSPLILYAATAGGVGRYDSQTDRWELMTRGLPATMIHDLAAGHGTLWAATDQGLYRYQVPPIEFGYTTPPAVQELLANFVHEPTIAQVREAAIRYAEVHPDKIRRWRRQAALKGLLPTVDIGMDRDTSRDIHVDEGSFPNFQILETEDRDAGLDLSVQWDLGQLLWNDDQTSIDVRSKLMVQLRDEILDEVTRTYFERRRLQVALLLNPPGDQQVLVEKELRIQELTALLDGLTGSYFSKSMQVDVR